MVTKVKATNDYWLLSFADNIVRRVARDSLIAFSITKLRELKLVTANFKNGFDFSDSWYLHQDLKKMYKLVLGNVYKAAAFLLPNVIDYVTITNGQRPTATILLIYDPSISRYFRRLNNQLRVHNLPYTLDLSQDSIFDQCQISLFCDADTPNRSLETYKLLMLIPSALTVLKTLSRKARFINEEFRNHNRSGRIGYQA